MNPNKRLTTTTSVRPERIFYDRVYTFLLGNIFIENVKDVFIGCLRDSFT